MLTAVGNCQQPAANGQQPPSIFLSRKSNFLFRNRHETERQQLAPQKPTVRKTVLLTLILMRNIVLPAQTAPKLFYDDSTRPQPKYLPDVTVVGRQGKSDYQQLPEIVGTSIYAGKKSALVVLDKVQGNIAMNSMRQVLAKVPGIHVWESDPSGIQVGIAARGLSPNRSWEFNVRQNGYDIAADPFGYPEAYYNPQLQAVQRIEVVRGQGSLQYGPQFGGLVNYILRNGSGIGKPFSVETKQTAGSNGLINSFNAIGGQAKRSHYYAFYDHRSGDGWRSNSRFRTANAFGTFTWYLKPSLSLTAELMRAHMRSQQPGGLTDAQVHNDPRQSFRERNWFDITWTTPALLLNYHFNEHARWNTKFFATLGDRTSVGYLQAITLPDSIDPATLRYSNRVVQTDHYRNYGLESRVITDYSLGKQRQTLSAGIRLYTGTTHRLADGKGSTGRDYDDRIEGSFPRDISFRSHNAALFAENIFRLTEKWLLIPGVRYEWLRGAASGRNGYSNGNPVLLQHIERSRSFLLGGIGTEYHITRTTEVYANFTQAYRPIQFANLQAPPTTDVVDPGLRDAKGYNIDLGYRGKWKGFLQFDLGVYYLQYNNRIGTVTVNGTPPYRLITNVGNSTSKGVEAYMEFDPVRAFTKSRYADLLLFVSYAYTDARYSGDHKDAATRGKRVENAPRHILRGGITTGYKRWLLTLQYNHTSAAFSDANNTVTPTANGNNGLIPAYSLIDATITFRQSKLLEWKAGINNLANTVYFTRRSGGYPGPGALPGDGRTAFLSAGMRF